MIFYFSGTGNSYQAAKAIAAATGEEFFPMAETVYSHGCSEFELKPGERIGFVFPVYAWGPPAVVRRFLDIVTLKGMKDNYTYSVATCGDNIGNTMKTLDKLLAGKGLKLDSAFSIRMPNNYIISFDVDSAEVEKKKLREAEGLLVEIGACVSERKKGVFKLDKGFTDSLLSIINPLFLKYAINTKSFHVDDRCTGCGLCERICSSRTIKVNGRPHWGKECEQCLACLHICPEKAIQYGKNTSSKGRYINPEKMKDIKELSR
ncbi:MAG: 4Fe-4S dicluster domain-containing protein [Clostridiales bacterium]|nr:4Fe-4S dicluster domain-containing protein [Clostridiales bacterium]